MREHGDLGLGTFENLDGEMVIVDGHFFQARSDGSVTEVDDDVLAPFVHLALQEATPSGEEASWFEHVAEDQYRETPELFSKEDGR